MLSFRYLNPSALITDYHNTLDERTELVKKPNKEIWVRMRGSYRGDACKIKQHKEKMALCVPVWFCCLVLIFLGIPLWMYALAMVAATGLCFWSFIQYLNLAKAVKTLKVTPEGFSLELSLSIQRKSITVFRKKYHQPLYVIHHHIEKPGALPKVMPLMKELSFTNESFACLWFSEKAYHAFEGLCFPRT